MTTPSADLLTFVPSFCALTLAFYILKGFVVGNQPPSFHHIYEPGWDYQVKLKLLAGSQVHDSPSSQVNRYLVPGLEPGRNPW